MTEIDTDNLISTCAAVEVIKSTYQSFLPDESCKSIYNNNEESHEWSGYYWITSRVYCGMNYTGSSCEVIFHNNLRDKPGYYRINNQWTYCNMTAIAMNVEHSISTCGSIEEGWRKVIKLDVSAGDDCPSKWTKAVINSSYSFCQKSFDGPGCSSVTFTTNGISYQKVCGKARGYQKGHPHLGDAFSTRTINRHYVNGLSITYGNPRQHIWTYANGADDDGGIDCPCDGAGGTTPSFIGNKYYCESGRGSIDDHDAYHFSDPLWDGSGCIYSNCCYSSVPNQPWFYRQLNESTSADIEARLCDERKFKEGFTMIDQLELYIQ